MSTSNLWTLAKSDYIKGVVVAILTPVVGYVYQVLTTGSMTFDWGYLGKLALVSFLGYLLKNFSTAQNGKILGKIG